MGAIPQNIALGKSDFICRGRLLLQPDSQFLYWSHSGLKSSIATVIEAMA